MSAIRNALSLRVGVFLEHTQQSELKQTSGQYHSIGRQIVWTAIKYPYYVFNMLYCPLFFNLNLRITCLAQNNLGCASVHFEP